MKVFDKKVGIDSFGHLPERDKTNVRLGNKGTYSGMVHGNANGQCFGHT